MPLIVIFMVLPVSWLTVVHMVHGQTSLNESIKNDQVMDQNFQGILLKGSIQSFLWKRYNFRHYFKHEFSVIIYEFAMSVYCKEEIH